MKVYTSTQIRELESQAEKYGVTRLLLMENAGKAVSDLVKRIYDPAFRPDILVVCGLGNNGGDALVAARHLEKFSKVTVLLLGQPEEIKTDEARQQWEIAKRMKLHHITVRTKEELNDLKHKFENADIILDGIFGTGVRHPIREPFSTAIELMNKSSALKVSIDIPSGLDPDTGKGGECAVEADLTITLFGPKKGIVTQRCHRALVITDTLM
jgi:NAD(P)H-hydrate epimerase